MLDFAEISSNFHKFSVIEPHSMSPAQIDGNTAVEHVDVTLHTNLATRTSDALFEFDALSVGNQSRFDGGSGEFEVRQMQDFLELLEVEPAALTS